ncbi:MAG: FixH family protein [Flavobacteriaceae bacterium]|nr:FixH family protein [Flavobacteriaceae bacterium]
MKFNWPTLIVLAFIGFMVFILSFVYLAFTDKKYDHELVTENYYEKELDLQQEINQQNLATELYLNLQIQPTDKGIEITFPETVNYREVTGKVSLYRPSDQRFDFEIPISLSEKHMLIPDSMLVGGRWDITIDWQYNRLQLMERKQIYY